MKNILVNSDKYDGQYIAIKNIDDNTIVGSGWTPDIALIEAEKNGILNPYLIYISSKDIVHIYYVS